MGTAVGYGIFTGVNTGGAEDARYQAGGLAVTGGDMVKYGDEVAKYKDTGGGQQLAQQGYEVNTKASFALEPQINTATISDPLQSSFIQCGTLSRGAENPFGRYLDTQQQEEIPKDELAVQVARIIGGLTSNIKSHPWQASLWVKSHTCGGTIIATNWVLFTAHCAVEYPRASSWTVYAGVSTLSEMKPYGQQSSASDLIIHKEFKTETYNKDIALLRLTKPLVFGSSVRPVCMPTSTEDLSPGTVCQISGWGAIKEGMKAHEYLRTVDVTVIDRKTCNRPDWLSGLVNQNMICAGTVDGSKDACQGDSGGPMTCYDTQADRFYLKGAVSWGIGCGKPKMPGVYTHVPKLNGWVRGVISNIESRYGSVGSLGV